MKKLLLIALALACGALGLSAQTTDYQAILARIDAQTNFLQEGLSTAVTMVTDKPGKDRSVTKARMFRRDHDKKFLILIEQPESQKGEGYLQINDNLKFYDPNTRIFSHTSLKEKFSDSQADNDDFSSSKLATDYTVTNGEAGNLGKFEVYILTLAATNDQVVYPMKKIWVTRDKNLLLKAEDYSLSQRLMRTNLYTNYQAVDGRYIPLSMLFIDNLNIGEKTQMTMSEVAVGKIPDKVFTEAYVEQVSK